MLLLYFFRTKSVCIKHIILTTLCLIYYFTFFRAKFVSIKHKNKKSPGLDLEFRLSSEPANLATTSSPVFLAKNRKNEPRCNARYYREPSLCFLSQKSRWTCCFLFLNIQSLLSFKLSSFLNREIRPLRYCFTLFFTLNIKEKCFRIKIVNARYENTLFNILLYLF